MVNAILPMPQDIMLALWQDGPLLIFHGLETGKIWITGLLLSLILGIFLSILMVEAPWSAKIFVWPLKVLQIVPTVVFIPLFILVFGFGNLGKVFVVASTCAFPIISVLYPALKKSKDKYKLVKKILGLNSFESYKHIYICSCLQDFFSSLRMCITYSWSSAITAELMGSEAGLGVYMARSLASLRPDRVWAMALVTACLVLVGLQFTSQLEKFFLYWKDPHQ